jgi:hypothetical protein
MLAKKALSATVAKEPLFVESVFSSYLYTGNGSTQTITNNIDLSTEGGLVWFKDRTTAYSHRLYDTVRGVTKPLSTNSTGAEGSLSNQITAFNSNGFSLGNDSSAGGVNDNGDNFVSWTFRQAEKFFDVVTYTGDGTSSRSISHNLGSTPGCIIIKKTSGTGGWWVVHRSAANGFDSYGELNSTGAFVSTGSEVSSVGSTSFTIGSSYNGAGTTWVVYLFAHDAGGFGDSGSDSVIKCGSYTTDGSGNATVDLGWEPQWLLVKRSDSTSDWYVLDIMRGMSYANPAENARIYANSSAAESSTGGTSGIVPTPIGFDSKGYIAANGTFIYIAIRRGPMKTPEAGTEVFEPFVDRTSIANKTNGTMGPVDMTMQAQVSTPLGGYHWTTFDRLRGSNKYILTASTAAEATDTSVSFDVNGGVKNATWFDAGGVGYNFKRAPGFFDVVCYTGTGSARTVTHNLGVAPELMIIKTRNNTFEGLVYASPVGNTKYLTLFSATNGANEADTWSSAWNNTSPTSSVFTVGDASNSNYSGATFVAYLFATLAGVSKVGSYTGTGSSQTINCGFTGGSRLVMIKRTDTTGAWIVFDSARGIVSGNDPYLTLNSTATEVTNTDYIDTYSSGFEITGTAPDAINANGGTFIYLAIA